ncbi:MAK10-like protein [Tanacetum coccineum]
MDSFQGLTKKVPHHGIDRLLQIQIFYDHVNPVTRRTIDQSADGKLRDLNAEESWELLEDLALYDNESWNDPRDFNKPIKAIALPQVVLTTLNIAWKIANKPLLNTYPRVSMKREASLLQTGMGIEPQQLEEPEPTLEDEFQDLHLNLPVLKVLAHSPIYNSILDQYVESLELGKNGSTIVQGEVPAKMEDLGLFTLPCRLGDSKPFDTLADLGSCVNIIPLYLLKKLNIGLLEETDHIFGLADGTKSYPIGIVKDVEVHIGKLKILNDFYVIDMKKDPETPLLVGRRFLAIANAVIDCRMAKIAVGEGITRLYLMRRSLEVLRKFHWMILGGRFNQLLHVSSLLLSKPREY